MTLNVPNDAKLREIAEANPYKIAEILRQDINAGDTARAASAAYFVGDRQVVRGDLIRIAMSHRSQMVREACLYGLDGDHDQSVVGLLKHIVKLDDNDIVREIAMEMLEDLSLCICCDVSENE